MDIVMVPLMVTDMATVMAMVMATATVMAMDITKKTNLLNHQCLKDFLQKVKVKNGNYRGVY